MEIKQYKPSFHITGEKGWINDPNGLIYYKGQYHAFYQYYPLDTKWGPMHWGHVVSKDLTNWEYLPIALAPGDFGDKDGCFSGSAIVYQDKLWLLYTGFTMNEGNETIRQLQCLASSEDGITFQKHGIVIGEEVLPKEYAPCDFRDPKVWQKDDTFYCVVAARKINGRGRILLFKSKDLFQWEFVNDIFGTDSPGAMIECPDYIDSLGVLTYSEQFQPQEKWAHLNIHSTRWHVGSLDYQTGLFHSLNQGIGDYGFDFYAPQSISNKEELSIGWLNMWDRNVPSAKYGFAGMLTVARKMSVKDNCVCQEPVVNMVKKASTTVLNTYDDKMTVGVMEIECKNLKSFYLKLRYNDDCETKFYLDKEQWVFDRSKSGDEIVGTEKDTDSLNQIRRMPYKAKENTKLTIVMDKYSLEIFENGNVLSSTIYPADGADKLALLVDATACVVTTYDIKHE